MESDTAEQISQMRQRVNEIVSSLLENGTNDSNIDTYNKHRVELQKMANKLLHLPTMQLREGILSEEEIEEVVKGIEKHLIDCTL